MMGPFCDYVVHTKVQECLHELPSTVDPEALCLVPRLSPLKRGRKESLVTFARKAVDFQRVIIHGIIVGHSYLSNILYVI